LAAPKPVFCLKPMKKQFAIALLIVSLCCVNARAQQSLDSMIDREIAQLVSTYKMLHAAPELSHYEAKSSAFVAAQLRALGFQVIENVGKYDRPEWKGYGVVAIMKNGPGPTVLVRSDMDGLPVEEKTGLPYASTVKTKNDAGQEVSVMHACGHDVHMTTLIGTAKMLAALKDRWSGTLVLIGQPAEETIDGAKAMIADGLFSKIPKPDFAIALHDSADLEAGKIGYTPGFAMANSTTVEITIRGRGGHGSKPEVAKDPVVVAAQTIVALQTIVSRENSPLDPAVVTVGSIHGGTKANIIPDEVKLQLTVRSYKEDVRRRILASIERIAKNVAAAAGFPDELAPIVKVDNEYTPALYNDPQLAERVGSSLKRALGDDNVVQLPPIMASEDFGHYGQKQQMPSLLFWLGAIAPERVEASKKSGKPLPSLHSSLFEPLPEPTLRTGVKAMTTGVLELMKK
jgi:amidohydrolase